MENFSRLFLGVSHASREAPTAPVTAPVTAPAPLAGLPVNSAPPVVGGDDPFVQLLASQPGLLLDMLQANPKMRSLMERNPQIRHALADPATIRDLLRQQRDPAAYQEAMRGHDRALANIENVPGGFQALRQFYTEEMADVEEGLSALTIGRPLSATAAVGPGYTMRGQRTTAPMPNPWQPARASGPASAGAPSPWSPPPAPLLHREPSEAELAGAEGRFQGELQVLHDMGFTDRRANVRALLATGGNVNSAIERLLLNS